MILLGHQLNQITINVTDAFGQFTRKAMEYGKLPNGSMTTCVLVYCGDRSLTSAVIAHHIMHSIVDDHVYKIKNIMYDIKENLHVDISYKKTWYGQRKAIQMI